VAVPPLPLAREEAEWRMSVRCRRWIDKNTGKQRESWQVDIVFRHPDGREQRVKRRSPVQTRRGAEQYERETRQSLLDGTYCTDGNESVEVPTLRAFSEKFLVHSETNDKPSAVYAKRRILERYLMPVFGSKHLDEIGPFEIESLKADMLRRSLSPKTTNNALCVLSRVLSLAEEWEILKRIPKMRWMKAPKPPFDFLSFDETERFLAAAQPKWRTMMLVALHTGLRRGELRALQWEDVDLVSGRIVVRRNLWVKHFGTPKNGRQREIPLNETVLTALKSHRHLRGPFVFCKENGSPVTNQMCRDAIVRTCRRAGFRQIGWHTLRHTFASHLVMKGRSLKEVQELLGHATIEMTMRYAHLSPHVKKDAVKVLDGPTVEERETQSVE
jgi:integrase